MSINISQVKKYIEENYLEDISLDDIAGHVGYSKYHLNRMFFDRTGQTLHKYIRERRLTHAADMLVNTEQPIVDIALGIGYTSQQSFTLAFKQMFGCTPNKYRSTYVVFERLECCYTSSKPNGSATIRLSQAYGRMAA